MTDQPENPEWFFARDSESVGPISQELLLERLQAGELNAATLVWRDGFDDWLSLEAAGLIPKTNRPPPLAQRSALKESTDARSQNRTVLTVIDWNRTFSVVGISSLLIGFAVYVLSFRLAPPLPVFFGLVALCVIVMMSIAHLQGVVLDFRSGTLKYPTLFFSRMMKISEIRDANMESYSFSMPGDNMGESEVRARDIRQRVYAINLSGEFGVRHLKFWSKRRRDQVLSYLSEHAPHIRITRWH